MRRQGIPALRCPLSHRAVVAVSGFPGLDQVRGCQPRRPAHHHAALGVDSAAAEARPDFAPPPDAAALKPVARNR